MPFFTNGMEFLFVIIILIMSIVVHEVSHGYAALALGDGTAKYQNRLTLNPLAHLDPVGSVLVPLLGYFSGGFLIGWAKPVPYNPYNLHPEKFGISQKWGEAIVAIAGPLSNIVIAVIFGIIIQFATSQPFVNLAASVVYLNITLAIFNLVPIPPLDGSKILFALIPYKFQTFRESLERYGFTLLLIFIFFFWDLLSPIIETVFGLLVKTSA